MKIIKLFSLGMFVLWGTAASAHYQIDGTKILNLKIPHQGLTRISVEQDTIQDVFVFPNDLSNHLNLHQSGHVFIAADGIEKPFYLTLITAKGEPQDLKVSLGKVSPGPILLKKKKEKEKQNSQDVGRWLQGFAKGLIPYGFRHSALKGRPIKARKFKAYPIATFRNETHEVTEYSVESLVAHDIPLDPRQVVGPEEAALFERRVLKAKEKCKLFIVREVQK